MSTSRDARKVSTLALEQGRIIAAAALSGKHAAKRAARLLATNHGTARRIVEGEAPAWAIIEIIRHLRPDTWSEMLQEANKVLSQKIGEATHDAIQGSGAVSLRARQILDSASADVRRSQEIIEGR